MSEREEEREKEKAQAQNDLAIKIAKFNPAGVEMFIEIEQIKTETLYTKEFLKAH